MICHKETFLIHEPECPYLNDEEAYSDWNGNPVEYTIGGVLSGQKDVYEHFNNVVQELESTIMRGKMSLNTSTQAMDTNPIKTAITVCDQLIQRQVYAIVVSKPENGDLSPASVSYTAGFYHIPVIGISSRDSAFSDKNIHVSFLRTVPPYSHQADVWVEMLKLFKYRQLVFIHSSDTDGRALLGRFQTKTQDLQADDQEVKVEKVEEFEPGQGSYLQTLLKIEECQARVYFLYANTDDATQIFADATTLNMTGAGYVWIVTEQALKSPMVPSGTLGLELVNANDEKAHINDTLHILAQALLELYNEGNITEAPILEDGATGRVAFDSMGDRIYAEYDITNIQNDRRNNFQKGVVVGKYHYSKERHRMELHLDEENIKWPGDLTQKPTGLMIPTHLHVLTIVEKAICVRTPYRSIQRNIPGAERMYCCSGYCIDLLKLLAEHCNFTYSLHVSFIEYGSLERNNETGKLEWNGLIGELVDGTADLIVAPLTINPERAHVMEFSKPFKYQGITILQKKTTKSISAGFILATIQIYTLGLGSRVSSHNPGNVQKEESLNFTSAIWFAWGVLLNSGIGEGTPRSFSARVLGMVWAGFAMIIVASYTANLAAFLVLDKPQTSLTGINDPRLRNPMENFTYATVKGSSVDMYFRRQVELSNMYRTMEGKHYRSPEEAIRAVKEEKLKAFIWDSSRLEYEAARDCDLITAGDLFGRSGYGVGLQKGSPWADKVTLAILDFHESGKMEDLDNKWILLNNDDDCKAKDDNSPATLGLRNMRGVFILVGVGIIGGLGLIVIEIIYKKHQMRKQKRTDMARMAINKWRGAIERRRNLRMSKDNIRSLRHNGLRGSGGSSTALTPIDSYTLSVDTLPRRELYPSDSTWRLAMDARQSSGGIAVHRNSCGSVNRLNVDNWAKQADDDEVSSSTPPPVPPHRSYSHEDSKSTLRKSTAPHHSHSSLLILDVNSGGINPSKSPSSSESSRKRKKRPPLSGISPSRMNNNNWDGGGHPSLHHHPSDEEEEEIDINNQCNSINNIDDPPSQSMSLHDMSSPEFPSIGSDRIPKPPPPPRLYWQQQQQQMYPGHHYHHHTAAPGQQRVRRRNYPTDDSDV
ncbi:GRIN1 [Lepeophtheirus salmonis]|uniref:Glutamate [NMDA] receptor subunit 1 n=1 Tax=Lepeophtheirus salmonis TaxID=72036 RepID=A0A7R8HBM1_LEPSM|nr:GRIN1 [Lepeophtheirus salmonis]CAF2988524.1 GRIN1 [Lepeophtheirus salmonis]